jgi:hypothetical protein
MHTFWSIAQSTSVRAAGQMFFLYGGSIAKIGTPREPGPHQSSSTSSREAGSALTPRGQRMTMKHHMDWSSSPGHVPVNQQKHYLEQHRLWQARWMA